MARVHHEVHQHLLELARIGVDRSDFWIERYLELDVLSDQAAKHVLEVADYGVDVHHPRLHHLLPAEREQLSGETGRTVGGSRYLPHIFTAGVGQVDAIQQHGAVTHYHREEVVEVVRDSAGELSDRLHLRRLIQVGFE